MGNDGQMMKSQPAHQLVVKPAGLRLRLIRSFATKHPLAPGGLTCRPRLLPMPASGQSVAETSQAIETPRVQWSDRQQQRQEQHQQQTQPQPANQMPVEKAAAKDTIDVLEACGNHAQQAQWQRTKELASASYLDR
ncbi:TPA: hypothetical protein ACH3X2_012153 [Trebouxia sp. C0005]